MSLRSIVAALGGDEYANGRRANIPAPGHSTKDRSVSLVLSGDRIVVHTFNNVDWREVLDDLREKGLIDNANRPTGLSSQRAVGVIGPSDYDRLDAARRLWVAGRDVAGTLSGTYVRSRGINRALPTPIIVRHHAHAPISVYRPGGRGKPALMVAVEDDQARLTAVEVTYIDAGGRRAVGLRVPRKTIGLLPPSCAMRIDPPDVEMLVGEGFFTTLSATECFQLPGWALMSTRNMRTWNAPEGVKRVLIAADRGPDGERSAEILAQRLRKAGVEPSIWLPPDAGDWNEAAHAGA